MHAIFIFEAIVTVLLAKSNILKLRVYKYIYFLITHYYLILKKKFQAVS